MSANDNVGDYLDRELADLPFDFGNVPAIPAVANLDGTPCEPDPAPAPLARIPQRGSAKSRVSFARDRRNLHILRDFQPDARSSRTKWPKPSLLADTPSLSDTPSKSTQKRKRADQNDTRNAPSWSRTTEIVRGHAFVRSVSTRGAGLSWTLNLGGKVAQAANDNPRRLKEMIHDRLSKALKASPLGARDFVFGVEEKNGRWHAHGVLDAIQGEQPQAEDVLRQRGGTWGSAHHEDKQAYARTVVWGPDGWARYLLKSSTTTRRLLGVKTVLSVTRGCRQRAQALWEASRREFQEPYQRAAAPVRPETAPEPATPACEPLKPFSMTRQRAPTTTNEIVTVLVRPEPARIAQSLAMARSRGPPSLDMDQRVRTRPCPNACS